MGGPKIEPGAQIGVNVTLLPHVRIGAGSLIGPARSSPGTFRLAWWPSVTRPLCAARCPSCPP